MQSLKILITGGTGFLGSAIVEALQEKHPEWSLHVLDLNHPISGRPGVRYFTGDITSPADIRRILRTVKPSVIIHTAGLVPPLASRYGRKDQDKVFKVNVEGTRNMLKAAREANVEAFVYTSSCTAVTDDMRYQYRNIDESCPTSSQSLIYGESKAAAEALVLSASNKIFSTCALRPSVLFGPGDTQLIPSIHACIAKHETPFVLGDGHAVWDITYVTNAANAHVLAVENLLSSKTAAGEAFFISNNEPLRFRDFCLAVWAHFGHYPPFEVHIPEGLAYFVGYLGECVTLVTGRPVTISRGSVKDACGTKYFDCGKAEMILGYRPRVGMEEGIRIACEINTLSTASR